MALTSCSDAYTDYMSRGCDALRVLSAAYDTGDQSAFDDAYSNTGSLEPASEEAGGNPAKRKAVNQVFNAVRTLHVAGYHPRNNGTWSWEHLALSEKEQQALDAGLSVCDDL